MDWTDLTRLLDTVDGKWDLGVLANLEDGPKQPTRLCAAINEQIRDTGHVLDPKVLNSTLQRMAEHGLVEHRQLASFPRSTLYSLTPQAYDMIAFLDGMDAWYDARRRYWRTRSEDVMHGPGPA